MKKILLIICTFIFSGCATIVNDANVPVTLSFSNGETGKCNLSNKRVSLQAIFLELLWSEDLMML